MKRFGVLAGFLLLSLPLSALADGTTGTLYYTRYGAPVNESNVKAKDA